MALEIILLVMLSLCVWYCYLLNKKIEQLNNNKQEFLKLFKEFDLAIIRAEAGVSELNKLSNDTAQKIYKAIDKAQFLLNDFTFMNDMGADVADRLEQLLEEAKNYERETRSHISKEESKIKENHNHGINHAEKITNILNNITAFTEQKNRDIEPANNGFIERLKTISTNR